MNHPSQRNVPAKNVRRKVWQIHVTTVLFVAARTTLHSMQDDTQEPGKLERSAAEGQGVAPPREIRKCHCNNCSKQEFRVQQSEDLGTLLMKMLLVVTLHLANKVS